MTCRYEYDECDGFYALHKGKLHLIANTIMSTYHLVRTAMFRESDFAVARRPRGIIIVVVTRINNDITVRDDGEKKTLYLAG